MRAFQMSNFKNKNCSELLLTNGMGLDWAPVTFLTLVFLRPPTHSLAFQLCFAFGITATSCLKCTTLVPLANEIVLVKYNVANCMIQMHLNVADFPAVFLFT